jgi:predicted hydrocarbon binding protein
MEGSVPKRALTFIKAKPDEKIYEMRITLKNVRGAVSKTAQVLSEAHVNILSSILFDAAEKTNVGYWTSLIDLSEALKNLEQVEAALQKPDVVQDVEAVKPEPLVFDTLQFPIMHGSSVAVIMSLELFGSVFDEIGIILTASSVAAVFYNAGKRNGAYMIELFEKRYGVKGDSLAAILAQSAKAKVWGEIEEFRIDQKSLVGRVRMRACFEALVRNQRKEKVCHWTGRFIAGAFGRVIGVPLETIELQCTANGKKVCECEPRQKA